MRTKLWLSLALVGVTAMGAFAASGIGSATSERSELAGDRERVTLDVVRGGPVPASASSAITSAKKKKVKILHFVASENVPVPAGSQSDIVSIACPGKAKLLSGDYATSGRIFADFFAAASAKRFEFGFADTSGVPGEASVGIFCAKGVK
jgi:hypothetical protein